MERGINEELGYVVSSLRFETNKEGEYTDDVLLKNVRLSFPSLFAPRAHGEQSETEGKERYQASLLIDKRIPESDFIGPLMDYAREMYSDGGKNKTRLKDDRCFLKDGDDYPYEGHAGHWVIKTANKFKPNIYDLDKSVVEEDNDKFYAGSYADVIIKLWYQNHKNYGKRVNARLVAVRWLSHGEKLGSKVKVHQSMFDDVTDVSDLLDYGDDEGEE